MFDIIARVSGSLEKRYFIEGSYVKKGQKLYRIEQRTYQSEYWFFKSGSK